MKRWYVIRYGGYGGFTCKRLAESASDAVRRFCEEGIPYEEIDVRSVVVERTGEVVPDDLWRTPARNTPPQGRGTLPRPLPTSVPGSGSRISS